MNSQSLHGKIDLLVLDFPPIGGGISRYLSEIARYLPADELRIIATSTDNGQTSDAHQPFPIHRLPVPTSDAAFARQLKFLAPFYFQHLWRQRNTSVILCGQAHYSLLLPARAISRLRRVPYGVFTYGLDLLYPQQTPYRRLFNASLRAADVIFADSKAAADIAQGLGVAPGRIEVVYPTVDLARGSVDERLVESLRQRHGLQGRPCLLTVGRLVERKGHDTVLQALPAIARAIPDVHYLIVGEGPNESHLHAMTEKLELSDRVTFVGFASDDEVAAYYALCDVFVMISRSIPEKGDIEGFGIVYLEANLMGKPVVAGDSGGVPEAVADGRTGLLVDPQSSAAVAEAAITLLQDKALAQRLGQQGYERVVREFSSEAAAAKVYARLQAVTAS